MERPILGITMGDPASIGPEIAAKALAEADVYAKSRPFVLGDKAVMADTLRFTKLPLTLHPIAAQAASAGIAAPAASAPCRNAGMYALKCW